MTNILEDSALDAKQDQSQKMREMIMLPKDFQPTEMDVVIGRGKMARTHAGNNRLRGLIEFMIPEYSAAGSNKDEKSYIIKEIVTQIRKSSPDGGFVKFDKTENRWFEVGDFLAREKISQTFRDAMGDSYSSSNPFKRKRRSFEKKHSAMMDTMKRIRGSSPTSVAHAGTSCPPSAPSPDLSSSPVVGATVKNHAVTPSPPMSSPSHHPVLVDLYKRPGQIGFARRSMLQLGMQGSISRSVMPPLRSSGMAHLALARHPVHPFSVSPTMAMPSRRASMPGGAYSASLVADVMQQQRLIRSAAFLRRTSAPGI